ncbi:hypothetical protein EPO05_00085 [Patescibacteria group bacterium]|nr:MAG: hypothetical protein EPO05_00085 [Patescibacteria group bacterium]
MWQIENEFKVIIGGNTYINTPNILVYKGTSLFTIRRSDDGLLGIDFDVYDKQGKRAATIKKGVIVQGNQSEYTITTGMDRYTLTENKTGAVICDIKKRSQAVNAELEVSVKLYTPDGFLFDATPTKTNIGGMQMTGCVMSNCGAGIVIG